MPAKGNDYLSVPKGDSSAKSLLPGYATTPHKNISNNNAKQMPSTQEMPRFPSFPRLYGLPIDAKLVLESAGVKPCDIVTVDEVVQGDKYRVLETYQHAMQGYVQNVKTYYLQQMSQLREQYDQQDNPLRKQYEKKTELSKSGLRKQSKHE